jgi:hypothetical protein
MIADGLNDVVPPNNAAEEFDEDGPFSPEGYYCVLIQEFLDYAAVDERRAMRIVDAAYASSSRDALLPRLKEAIKGESEEQAPHSKRQLLGYIDALAGLESDLDAAYGNFADDLKTADRALNDWQAVLREIEADVETEPEDGEEQDAGVLDDLTFGRDILQAFYNRSAELGRSEGDELAAPIDELAELPDGHALAYLGSTLEAILAAGRFGAPPGTPPATTVDDEIPPGHENP